MTCGKRSSASVLLGASHEPVLLNSNRFRVKVSETGVRVPDRCTMLVFARPKVETFGGSEPAKKAFCF